MGFQLDLIRGRLIFFVSSNTMGILVIAFPGFLLLLLSYLLDVCTRVLQHRFVQVDVAMVRGILVPSRGQQ